MNKQAMNVVQVMQINSGTGTLDSRKLGHGEHEVLGKGVGTRLTCTSGMLWVTLENDAVDHILAEHESLSLGAHRKVVLSGLRPSSFTIA